MAIALIVLALGSVVAGYVGVPHVLGGSNAIESYLEPSFVAPGAVAEGGHEGAPAEGAVAEGAAVEGAVTARRAEQKAQKLADVRGQLMQLRHVPRALKLVWAAAPGWASRVRAPRGW